MKSGNLSQKTFFTILILGESIGLIVKWSLKEGFNLEGVVSFCELQNHSLIFLITDNQNQLCFINQNIFNLRELFTIGNVQVQSIINVHSVLIGTFFSIVLPFFKANNYQIVLPKLLNNSFLSLYNMSFDLLSLIELKNILFIAF